ncbi:uncharacterized protein LOC142350765 [Convolutriloba macropyga]|uniref:uncharacterized protein LOC142350765 n=1 Tax=Convolutriloba macropyga TaxID=536237 RepID=UPI003F5284FE
MLRLVNVDLCGDKWYSIEDVWLQQLHSQIEISMLSHCAQNGTLFTHQNIQELRVDCISQSFLFNLIGSNSSQLYRLTNCYWDSIQSEALSSIFLNGESYQVDSSCLRACPMPITPFEVYFTSAEVLLVVCVLLISSVCVFILGSYLVCIFRKQKQNRFMGYRLQRNDISVTSFRSVVTTTTGGNGTPPDITSPDHNDENCNQQHSNTCTNTNQIKAALENESDCDNAILSVMNNSNQQIYDSSKIRNDQINVS